jgi:hypothetical protein
MLIKAVEQLIIDAGIQQDQLNKILTRDRWLGPTNSMHRIGISDSLDGIANYRLVRLVDDFGLISSASDPNAIKGLCTHSDFRTPVTHELYRKRRAPWQSAVERVLA